MLQNRPAGGIVACTFAALLCVANAWRKGTACSGVIYWWISVVKTLAREILENVRWLFISLLSRGFYRGSLPVERATREKEPRALVSRVGLVPGMKLSSDISISARYRDTACDVALNFEYIGFPQYPIALYIWWNNSLQIAAQRIEMAYIYILLAHFFHQCHADSFVV